MLIFMTISTYAICQSSLCDSSNYESNEGPGGSDCCSNSGGSSGYEECKSYLSKSTVSVYSIYTGQLKYQETDSCSGSTLTEYYMDCNIGNDGIKSTTKNCNNYDDYGSWVYYCTSSQVKRHRTFYNYGCSNGACRISSNNWVDDTLVSSLGDSDYCTERKSRGCSLCGHEDYDCDWDSECSGSLECQGGSPDGCCYSDETWDDSSKECCECTSGACCDGCNYKSSSYVCDSHYGSYFYACPTGQCLASDVERKDKSRYCSGSSTLCNGNTEWNDWEYYDGCGPSEFCDADNGGYSPFSCSTAECSSGDCCDSTCGVYEYKSSSTVCSQGTDYDCPWGEDIDDDVGKRSYTQYCQGSSSSCSGTIDYGDWSVQTYCTAQEYCENNQCNAIPCFDKFDCGGEGTSYWFCQDDDTWATYHVGVCHNPGTKTSYCTNHEEDRLYEDCGEDVYGDNYCSNGDVYRDVTDRGCSGHAGGGSGHASCFENQTKQLVKDCQIGCTINQCNEDILQSFTIQLKTGWNLISFPLDLLNKQVGTIFSQYSKIFAYANKWIELDSNSEINESIGYWVKVDSNYLLEIEGTELSSMNPNLNTGWNIIGYPYLEQKNISELYTNAIVYAYNNSQWYSYNPDKPSNTLDKFTPGYAYWIKNS